MTVAVNEKLRIKLKGYDHTLVDASAAKIVEAAKKTGARVSGPIPLPTQERGRYHPACCTQVQRQP